jgi:hypothetical protein
MEEMMLKGSCLCGAVSFELTGELRPPFACHCTQCRKTSGHYWSSTNVPRGNLTFSRDDGLKWYQSSDHARRGFCGTCGSSLFWDMPKLDVISVAACALESPTGLRMARHIFVADKGDYYDIADGLPQLEAF